MGFISFYAGVAAEFYDEINSRPGLPIIIAWRVVCFVLMTVSICLYHKTENKQHFSWHIKAIIILTYIDAITGCLDLENLRYRLSDFDLARILWLRIMMLVINSIGMTL